jgi:REP element-mobilizing transposase RayT
MRRYYNEKTKRAFYHIIIRVPEHIKGQNGFAFEDVDKEYLKNLLFQLERIYLFEVLSYCVMSTHVHLILSRDNKAHINLSLKETAERFQLYYDLKQAPDARSAKVRKFRIRLNNISEFMRDYQRRFTFWYNKKFEGGRKGSLWHPRFKSVALTSRRALIECMKYVELNPVRAKIVTHPSLYAYCSYSHICKDDQLGCYFKEIIVKNIRHLSEDKEKHKSNTQVFKNYSDDLEVLAYFVAENKNIKSVDPYLKAHFINSCKLWSQLKIIDGVDALTGIGHGKINPRTIEFEKPDGSCQQIPICDVEF